MKILKLIPKVILIGLLVWFLVSHQEKIRANASQRDSIAYWAAGKLIVHHQNPYSVADVFALQRSQGYTGDKPLMMRPMPWSLWIFLPLGLLDVYWGWVVWTAILFASLVISIRITWRFYGDGSRPPAVFFIAAYLFAPVVGCLVGGAMGMVLLLGIILFLFLEKQHPFLAGVALLIPFSKPHIFALVWPVLAIWVVTRRRWPLVAGLSTAFVVALSIAMIFDPRVLQHYREMMQAQAIQNEFIPALSGMIRVLFFRRFFWVQFVPLGMGLLWTTWYYWHNRYSWDWRTHGLAVLVVSVLTTPYAWMTDEVVLLPAVLQGVLWLHTKQLKVRSQLAIMVFALLNFLLLLILRAQVPPATGIYFWSGLVWFSWYFYARSFRHTTSEDTGSLAASEQLSIV